jgi:hypothetical protein
LNSEIRPSPGWWSQSPLPEMGAGSFVVSGGSFVVSGAFLECVAAEGSNLAH